VLADDRDLQPDENVVPIVRRETVERWGTELVPALDGLSRRLTTSALQQMNRQVDGGESVRDTAADWLTSVDLAAG